ncbi:MAG TPA: HEPN domain-containing protein [Chthoniobacterales bacterium]
MGTEKSREIEAWLLKAQNDLDAARLLAEADPPKRDIAVYHCQQAAEKTLKAWLVFRDIPFPKTHDLEKLLSLDLPNTPALARLAGHGHILSPYAVEFRYPGDLIEPDGKTCEEALRLASEVGVLIRALLKGNAV